MKYNYGSRMYRVGVAVAQSEGSDYPTVSSDAPLLGQYHSQSVAVSDSCNYVNCKSYKYYFPQKEHFVAPGLPKISTYAESRDEMVVTISDANKSANVTFEQTGVSTETGQPTVTPVNTASPALLLVPQETDKHHIIPPPERSLPPQELDDDFEPTSPSQAQVSVYFHQLYIQALCVYAPLFVFY